MSFFKKYEQGTKSKFVSPNGHVVYVRCWGVTFCKTEHIDNPGRYKLTDKKGSIIGWIPGDWACIV